MIIIILIIILLVGIVLILADKKEKNDMTFTDAQLEYEIQLADAKETARAGVFFYEDDGEPAPELPGWDKWVELTGCDFIPATVSMREYFQTVGIN